MKNVSWFPLDDVVSTSPVSIHDDQFSILSLFFLQGSGFEFPSEVWLSRCQSALFETSLAISSKYVAFEKLISPMKPEEICYILVSV